MRPTWWFQRFPADDDDERPSGRAAHPSGQGHWSRGPLLEEADWSAIEAFLESQSEEDRDPPSSELLDALVASVELLRSFADSDISGVDPVTNHLLDVWAIARQIGYDVARPAERLLSALAGRNVFTSAEITAVCDETRWAAFGSVRR